MVSVDRAQVMAFRVAALGLAERGDQRPADLPVLDLGVQEYMPGSQRVALAARTSAALDDDRLITVWPPVARLTCIAEPIWRPWSNSCGRSAMPMPPPASRAARFPTACGSGWPPSPRPRRRSARW